METDYFLFNMPLMDTFFDRCLSIFDRNRFPFVFSVCSLAVTLFSVDTKCPTGEDSWAGVASSVAGREDAGSATAGSATAGSAPIGSLWVAVIVEETSSVLSSSDCIDAGTESGSGALYDPLWSGLVRDGVASSISLYSDVTVSSSLSLFELLLTAATVAAAAAAVATTTLVPVTTDFIDCFRLLVPERTKETKEERRFLIDDGGAGSLSNDESGESNEDPAESSSDPDGRSFFLSRLRLLFFLTQRQPMKLTPIKNDRPKITIPAMNKRASLVLKVSIKRVETSFAVLLTAVLTLFIAVLLKIGFVVVMFPYTEVTRESM